MNPNDTEVRVDYVDESGDAFEEYIVYHPKFITWMKVNGIEVKDTYTQEELDALVARSPYFKATANDVDWLEKVRMQGSVQKWVDHSISVTINLPSDVTEELVGNLYVEAWRSGCKGCTVYRDGSRSGVLIAVEKKKEQVSPEGHPIVMWYASRTTRKNGLRSSDCSTDVPTKYSPDLPTTTTAYSAPNR